MVFWTIRLEDAFTGVEFVFRREVVSRQALHECDGSDNSYTAVTRSQRTLYLLALDARGQVVAGTEKLNRQTEHEMLPNLLLH